MEMIGRKSVFKPPIGQWDSRLLSKYFRCKNKTRASRDARALTKIACGYSSTVSSERVRVGSIWIPGPMVEETVVFLM